MTTRQWSLLLAPSGYKNASGPSVQHCAQEQCRPVQIVPAASKAVPSLAAALPVLSLVVLALVMAFEHVLLLPDVPAFLSQHVDSAQGCT